MNTLQPLADKPKNSPQLLDGFVADITLNLNPKVAFNHCLLLGQGIGELGQIGSLDHRIASSAPGVVSGKSIAPKSTSPFAGWTDGRGRTQ
jgi:hypothetical protein